MITQIRTKQVLDQAGPPLSHTYTKPTNRKTQGIQEEAYESLDDQSAMS